MSSQILPRTVFEFADELETEAAKFKACFGLIREVLQFNYNDPEQCKLAQERLYFLTSSLGSTQERLEHLTAAAYALSHLEAQAAA